MSVKCQGSRDDILWVSLPMLCDMETTEMSE